MTILPARLGELDDQTNEVSAFTHAPATKRRFQVQMTCEKLVLGHEAWQGNQLSDDAYDMKYREIDMLCICMHDSPQNPKLDRAVGALVQGYTYFSQTAEITTCTILASVLRRVLR
jgi:hypothetical protein